MPPATTLATVELILAESAGKRLVNLHRFHLPLVMALLTQPKVARYLPKQLALIDELMDFPVSQSTKALRARRTIAFGLFDNASLLAVVELNRLQRGSYELGYAVTSSHWQQGIGTLLLTLTCRVLKSKFAAKHCLAYSEGRHPAQLPLLKVAGFKWAGRELLATNPKKNCWVERFDCTL